MTDKEKHGYYLQEIPSRPGVLALYSPDGRMVPGQTTLALTSDRNGSTLKVEILLQNVKIRSLAWSPDKDNPGTWVRRPTNGADDGQG